MTASKVQVEEPDLAKTGAAVAFFFTNERRTVEVQIITAPTDEWERQPASRSREWQAREISPGITQACRAVF